MKIVNLVEDEKDDFEKHLKREDVRKLSYGSKKPGYCLSDIRHWDTDINKVVVDTPIYEIPYKLDTDVLYIVSASLKTLNNIPDTMDDFYVYDCNNFSNADLSACTIKELEFKTCRKLQTLILPKMPAGKGSLAHIEQCVKLNKIVSRSRIKKLRVKNCGSINSLRCIDIDFVDALNLEYTKITRFESNNIHTNKFLIRCELLTSFSGVEDVDVREQLTLSRVIGMNNLIACLLTPAPVLILNTPDSSVQRIISEYFEKLKKK